MASSAHMACRSSLLTACVFSPGWTGQRPLPAGGPAAPSLPGTCSGQVRGHLGWKAGSSSRKHHAGVRGVARLGGADWTSGSRFPLALKRLRRSAASHTRRPCICPETTEESVEAAARLGCAGAQGVGGRVGGAMGAAGVATVHWGAAETRGPCGLWPGQEWKAPACAMAGLGLGPPPPPRALAGPLVWRGPRDSRGPSATSAGHAGSSQRARALPARGRHMLKCGLVCQGRLGPSGAPALLGDPTLQAYTRGS